MRTDLPLSVSELNRMARQMLEGGFPLLWVSGEISNLVRAASGHVYFSLKDESAQVRCVMFRSKAQSLPWRLENGQHVEARALVTLYEARGDFQLNVDGMRREGLGRLFEAFTRLKEKLAAEGLFDTASKRPLPAYPRRLGLVTSPDAAALRDVLAALRRRAPQVGVVLYPTRVQGEGAGDEVTAAIALANRRAQADGIEALLLVRGGGSIEDLWAFNEEAVARALAASELPVICGVGHESDTTIADFAADVRAATPTAAAELITQHWLEARNELAGLAAALAEALERLIRDKQQRLDRLGLRLVHPGARMASHRDNLALLAARLDGALRRQIDVRRRDMARLALRLGRARPRIDEPLGRVAMLAQRLRGGMRLQLQQRQHTLTRFAEALEHLNPENTLQRGFAIVRGPTGMVITRTDGLQAGDRLDIRLAEGRLEAEVRKRVAAPPPSKT